MEEVSIAEAEEGVSVDIVLFGMVNMAVDVWMDI
jgi:hypothetical protein